MLINVSASILIIALVLIINIKFTNRHQCVTQFVAHLLLPKAMRLVLVERSGRRPGKSSKRISGPR